MREVRMDSNSTAVPAQRTLAAILFTDAVGYSTLAGTDEELALKTMERDFNLMQSLAQQFEGRVAKNTGDGLLMLFSSASQAVACAVEIQKQLAEQEALDPTGLHLPHRIGIHVGDVMLSENDAKGNGVNVAARLQAEARPGGIWISQTVFDLVKQTLPVHAVALGNKQLRNLPELVGVYELSVDSPRPKAKAPGKRFSVPVAAVVIGLLLVVVGLLAGYIIRQKSEVAAVSGQPTLMKIAPNSLMPELDLYELKKMGEKLDAQLNEADKLKDQKSIPDLPPPGTPKTPATNPKNAPAEEPKKTVIESTVTPEVPLPITAELIKSKVFQDLRNEANRDLSYMALVTWLAQNRSELGQGAFVDMAARYGRLQMLLQWFGEELDAATEASPLVVNHPMNGRGMRTLMWAEGDSVVISENGKRRTMPLASMPRDLMSQAMLAAIRQDQGLDGEDRADMFRALGTFTQEFRLKPLGGPRPGASVNVGH